MRIADRATEFLEFLPPDSVIYRSSEKYAAQRLVWNGMIDRNPGVILCPRTSEDVSRIVRIAATSGLPLSVRGGGHSFPGFSTCDDGIVLDLCKMDAITIDPAARIANVGGGALLGDLDRATAPYGLVVPAGVVSHTGAGGLTLGGGMGYTSRRFGMTVDNLLGVELVTADGSIVEVDGEKDAELFWGLRGGGGNFGVVTQFRYRMHELGKITVGTWSYPPERCAEALVALGELAKRAPRSLTITLGSTATGLFVTAFHSGPEENAEAAVSEFSSLAGPGTGGISYPSFVEHQSRSDFDARWGRRYYGRGGFIESINNEFAQTVAESAAHSPSADAEIYMIQLGGAVSDVPDDATAYSGRSASFFWLIQPIWDATADDVSSLAWGRKYGSALAGLSQEGNYVNEQGEIGKDTVLQAYGKAKYDRLAVLKGRVDPQNLFRLNQNITPRS